MDLNAYLPMDRVSALLLDTSLPEKTHGTALFADISGFTALTEMFAQVFGARRGAEELTQHLNRIYDLLIDEVHRYRGSVISFSGDGITCWFDGEASARAIQCAFATQQALADAASITINTENIVTLGMKIALATGLTRRLLVGDPAIQRIEALAGTTIAQLAQAEGLAERGEIIVDTATLEQSGVTTSEWRMADDGQRFAIVERQPLDVAPIPWETFPSVDERRASQWVIPGVYARLKEGLGEYVTELRPAVSLFLQFEGIDYEADSDARDKLDQYIRHVQQILTHFDGTLIQLTTGDKGSYLYGAFGVPVAQEDAAQRAAAAALELSVPFSEIQVRLGLSQGIMRTGVYGGSSRRTYGVLGHEVNLAARLMQNAQPYQILGSGPIRKATDHMFAWEDLPPIHMKGLRASVSVAKLVSRIGTGRRTAAGTQSANGMVGRAAERLAVNSHVDALEMDRRDGLVIIEGEAGIGKSTLLAAMVENVRKRTVTTLIGAGDAIEKQPYFAWRAVFNALFNMPQASDSIEQRRDYVLSQITLTPDNMDLLPLLNAVVPLGLLENNLTAQLSADGRAYNTEKLLVALLQQAAKNKPLLLILEDAHWLDSSSWALLRTVQTQVHPLLLVLATRPQSNPVPPDFRYLADLPHVAYLRLQTLPPDETVAFVAQRLGVDALPEALSDLITQKAEGHPFFSEELAYALRDAGLISVINGKCEIVATDFGNLDLPNTVEGVVASRIGKLLPAHQLTIKVASVIGRLFLHRTLHDIYPLSADQQRLADHFTMLEQNQLIALEAPQPDLAYLFRHIITVEVAYNMLLFSQRRELHRDIAEWYEQNYAKNLAPHYGLLAYHWSRAEVIPKKVEYLEKAGSQALSSAAYPEAIDYFTQLVTMLDNHELSVSTIQHAKWVRALGEAHHGLFLINEAQDNYKRVYELAGSPVPTTQRQFIMKLLVNILRQWKQRLVPPTQLTPGSQEYEWAHLLMQTSVGLTHTYAMHNETLPQISMIFSNTNQGEQIPPTTMLAELYAGIGYASRLFGLSKLADSYKRLAIETAQRLNSLASLTWVLEITQMGYMQSGHLANSAEQFVENAKVFDRLGDVRRYHENIFYGALAFYLKSDFRSSLEMIDIQASRADIVIRSGILTFKAQSLLQLGEVEQSLDLLRQSVELVAHLASFRMLAVYGMLAQTYLRQGAYDLAEEAVNKAAPFVGQAWALQYEGISGVLETYLALWEKYGDSRPQYQSSVQRAIPYIHKYLRIHWFCKPRAARYDGLYAWLTGKPRRAFRAWDKSLRDAQQMGMPFEEARAYYELGRHSAISDPKRTEYLNCARTIFERLTTPYYLGLIYQELSQSN